MDVATGAVATLFREVRVRQDRIQVFPNPMLRYAELSSTLVLHRNMFRAFLRIFTSDTTISSRLLPKRLSRRGPLRGRLLLRRLLSRRFSWRHRLLPGSTVWFSDLWVNAWWRGVRGGRLGGSRERRRCKSCGSVSREKSGKTHVLEGHGVGEGGVLVQGSMEAGLSLRD